MVCYCCQVLVCRLRLVGDHVNVRYSLCLVTSYTEVTCFSNNFTLFSHTSYLLTLFLIALICLSKANMS